MTIHEAGWYDVDGEWRFYDGEQWTEHRAQRRIPTWGDKPLWFWLSTASFLAVVGFLGLRWG